MQIINNNVKESKQVAQQQKYILHLENVKEEVHYNEVSSVNVSIHPEEIDSREAIDTFFDMLSCSGVD